MEDIQVNIASVARQNNLKVDKKKLKKENYLQRKEKRYQRQQLLQFRNENSHREEKQYQGEHQIQQDTFQEYQDYPTYQQFKTNLISNHKEQDDYADSNIRENKQNQNCQIEKEEFKNSYNNQRKNYVGSQEVTADFERKQFKRKTKIQIEEEEQPLQFELPQKETQAEQMVITETQFQDSKILSPQVLRALSESNYIKMTDIQVQSIPVVYENKNVIIRSATGSGKTLAYMAPLMSRLSQKEKKIDRQMGTMILIICPTRELAVQCNDVGLKCGRRCPWVVVGGLLGGENPQKEKARIRKGVTILIGTPGRILYHLQNTQSFKYDNINTIVFEEWDRLLDLGFEKNLSEIINHISLKNDMEKIQKILVSAHATTEIAQIPGININPQNFEMIGFKQDQILTAKRKFKADRQDWLDNTDTVIPSTLSQFYTFVSEKFKNPFLLSYIMSQRGKKCLIFVATCDEVEFYFYLLENVYFFDRFADPNAEQKKIFKDFAKFKLHGNIDQKERSKTYFAFRKVKGSAVLISTSVASRGLDFPDVPNILLFDPPDGQDDYVNKIGRTARIDNNGSSLLLMCENKNTRDFVKTLQDIQEIEAQNYFNDFKGYLKSEMGIIERMPDKNLLQAIRVGSRNDRDSYLLARKAYVSFIRAYTRLKQLKVKAMNLHDLSKSFGLEKAVSTETKEERYQKELHIANREKFRNQGIELNTLHWDSQRKRRKVMPESELNKMEFV